MDVEVYDPTGVTLQTALDDSWGRRWLDELSGPGSWSLDVANTDVALGSVAFDDVVKFDLGAGVEFAGLVESMTDKETAPGEEADQYTSLAGRQVIALAERTVVYPSRGIGAKPLEQVRLFNWASVDYVEGAEWDPAVEQKIQSDDTAVYGSAPEGWPDKDAYWIWGSVFSGGHPEGECYFRKTFTLAAAKTCRFFVTADDEYDLYVDGVLLSSESRFYLWTKPTTVDLELDAGTHLIAIRGNNIPLLEPVINAGAVIATVWTTSGDGTLDALVVSTDSSWSCLAYPTEPPGMTPGKILRLLVEAAQAEGDLPGVTLGFTDTLDSDGAAWPTVADVAAKVGRDLLSVLFELAESLIDVAMTPALVLEAWVFGTRGGAGGAVSNVLECTHQSRGQIVNALLVRWAMNMVEVVDAASVTANGRRTGYLEVGEVQSELEAIRIGTEALALRKDRRWATSLATATDPSVRLGDTATVPDPDGGTSSSRCRSWSVSEDQDGQLTHSYEFRDVVEDVEVRFQRWLARMASGALSGGSASASPAPPGLKRDVRGGLKDVVPPFSAEGPLTVSTSLPVASLVTGNLTEVRVELDVAASSGDTVVRLLQNGSPVTGSTVTIAAGNPGGRVQMDGEPVAAGDVMKAELTAVGTGAEGLSVHVGAI